MHYAPPRAVAVRLLPAGSIRAPSAGRRPRRPRPPPPPPKPKIEKPAPRGGCRSLVEEAVLLPAKEDKKKPTPPPVSAPGHSRPPPP